MTVLQLRSPQRKASTTTGSTRGINRRDMSELMDLENALQVINCRTTADARLLKSKGYKTFKDHGKGVITFFHDYGNNFYIFTQDGKIIIEDLRDNTFITIEENLNGKFFVGLKYDDYFFIGSKDDQLRRIEKRILLDNTSGISVGSTIVYDNNSYGEVLEVVSDQYVVVKETSNSKLDVTTNDKIDFDNTEYTFTGYEIASVKLEEAPAPNALKLFETRLTALSEGVSYYSKVDEGSNPPFKDWTESTVPDDAGNVRFSSGGEGVALGRIGDYIYVLQENGEFAYDTREIDSSGVAKKIDVGVMSRITSGGSSALIHGNKGIFYLGRTGIWNILTLGIKDQVQTEQYFNISKQLGTDYFKDINLDARPDMFMDDGEELIYITFAKNSDINNTVLVYDIANQSYTELKGWNIQKFYKRGVDIYGTSSLDGKIYKLFTGYSLDGKPMTVKYEQEVKMGDIDTRKTLLQLTVQANMTKGQKIKIELDARKTDGQLERNVVRLQVNAGGNQTSLKGYRKTEYGSAYGGTSKDNQLAYTLADSAKKVRNFKSLIFRLTETSIHPFEFNFARFEYIEGSKITKRKITTIE